MKMVLLNNPYTMLDIWQTCLWPPYGDLLAWGAKGGSSASPYAEWPLQISHKTRFSKMFAQSL